MKKFIPFIPIIEKGRPISLEFEGIKDQILGEIIEQTDSHYVICIQGGQKIRIPRDLPAWLAIHPR